MLSHKGATPFSCNVCCAIFRRACDLDNHRLVHDVMRNGNYIGGETDHVYDTRYPPLGILHDPLTFVGTARGANYEDSTMPSNRPNYDVNKTTRDVARSNTTRDEMTLHVGQVSQNSVSNESVTKGTATVYEPIKDEKEEGGDSSYH